MMIVFGELFQKGIACKYAEKFSMIAIKPINLFAKILKPFVSYLSFSTDAFVKFFGFNTKDAEDKVTLEEIESLVQAGQEQGVINPSTREMIDSIITFEDKVAEEIMTARTSGL